MDLNVKKDQEKLGSLYEAAQSLVKVAESAGRNMDTEENAKFDSILVEHGELEKAIERKLKLNGIASDEVENIEKKA